MIESNESGKLNLLNESTTNVSARGIVQLSTRTVIRRRTICETLLILGLRTNLLSVGKIVDNGFTVTFAKEKTEVTDSNGNIKLAKIGCSTLITYMKMSAGKLQTHSELRTLRTATKSSRRSRKEEVQSVNGSQN